MSGKYKDIFILLNFLPLFFCFTWLRSQDVVCGDCAEGHGYYNSKHNILVWRSYNENSNLTVIRYFKKKEGNHWIELEQLDYPGFCAMIVNTDSVGVVQQIRNLNRKDSLKISFHTSYGESLSVRNYQIDWHLNLTPLYFDRFLIKNDTLLITTEQHVGFSFFGDSLYTVSEDIAIDPLLQQVFFWKDNPDNKLKEFNYWDIFKGRKYFQHESTLYYITSREDTIESNYQSIHSIKALFGEFNFMKGYGVVFRKIDCPDIR